MKYHKFRGILSLDIGCGNNKRGDVGLDINPASDADVLGDMHRTPFRDGVFSRGFCYLTIEHSENPLVLLREIKRIIRGCTIVSIPNILNVFAFLRWVLRGRLSGSDDHLNGWTIREFRNLVKRAGLEYVSYSTDTTDYYNKPFLMRRIFPRGFDKDIVVKIQ